MLTVRHSAYLKLLFVVLIWGAAPPIIKYTLHYFPTDLFLTYRFFISIITMIPILTFVEKGWTVKLAHLGLQIWLILVINSLLGSVIQLNLLFWGLQFTTSIEGSIINALSPILVAISGVLFLHEKVTTKEKWGLSIAFIGTIILVAGPVQNYDFNNSLIGNVLIFLGTFCWAIYTVISKKSLRLHLSPLFLTTIMFLVGFLTMFMLTIITHTPQFISHTFTSAPLLAHLGVLYMALMSGSLAYYLYQSATKSIEISQANIFLYLEPLVTLPISYFVLHEKLNSIIIIGCIIVLTGVILSEIKIRQR